MACSTLGCSCGPLCFSPAKRAAWAERKGKEGCGKVETDTETDRKYSRLVGRDAAD